MAQMLALGLDFYVEKPCYRRKTSLVVDGTRTQVLCYCLIWLLFDGLLYAFKLVDFITMVYVIVKVSNVAKC